MNIVIHDTNTLISLIDIKVIDSAFAIGHRLYTTDLIINEMQAAKQQMILPYIANDKLNILESSEEALKKIGELARQYPLLTLSDCSALHCAKQLPASLLTRDIHLSKSAEQFEIPIREGKWLFEQLIYNQPNTNQYAGEKLAQLIKTNNNLHQEEYYRLVSHWKRYE